MRDLAEIRAQAPPDRIASPHRSALVVRLGIFVWERFSLAYVPLIAALGICGATAGAVASDRQLQIGWSTAGSAVAVALAFLQLRILDEIRDAEVDRLGRPHRPLPRGLVTASELRAFAVVVALASIAVALPLGTLAVAILGLSVAVIWAFGTDQERRLPIRHGIVGEALVHSIISPLLLLFVWVASAGPGHGGALAAALLLVWGASLALEVARKTVRADEERPGVSTYSSELGRAGALLLAALAISASCLGAGGFAISVAAPTAVTAVPVAGAVAIPLAVHWWGRLVGTIAIRVAAGTIILGLLLWPVVVMLVVA